MKVSKVILSSLVLFPSLVGAFLVQLRTAPTISSLQHLSTNLGMAKGFGSQEEKNVKAKSEAQTERERASSRYDSIAASGGQQYAIFVRQFGNKDDSWLPCGSIAVRRGEQVSNAIFGNEEALKVAIVRTYPRLKGYETEFEYGFNLKIYPDEPVEVAVKQNRSTGPSLGNWISNLLSPVDASNVPPPPTV